MLISPTLILGLLLTLTIIVAGIFLLRRKPSFDALSLKVMSVRLPQTRVEEQKDFAEEINKTEQFISALSAINKPCVLETSVHNSLGDIHFYLAVPRDVSDFVKQQIRGFFPDAQVTDAHDYTIFNPDGGSAGAYLTLNQLPFLPVRTYRESGIDTFAGIVSTLSKLAEAGDGASLQVVLRPAYGDEHKEINKAIESLKQGKKFVDIIKKPLLDLRPPKELEFVGKIIAPGSTPTETPQSGPVVVDEEMVRTLSQKISKPLFAVNVRLITSSGTQARAEDILLSLAGSFSQYTAPLRNGFKVVKPRALKKLMFDYIFREFDRRNAMILNTEEVASIFHLPTATVDIPRINWLKAREAEPPNNLPTEGVVVGTSTFRGEEKLVRMTDKDRRRHFYTVGQTGTGKSFMMLNMAVQDMEAGKGLCVIDPHGDLIDDILARVPIERIDDVIVFDPGDLSRPLGLNMLEYDFNRPEEKTFIVNEIQSIFNRLFDKETMGPMFEQYMRNSLLLLMEDAKNEPATLMEVPRIFTDPEFRNKKLARITNPTVIDFWTKEASKTTGEQGLANMTPYITSKFGNFIANDYMRPIIGQPQSAFNFRQVMDDGKILLVNLAKGRIGDINAGLLGMIITGRILLAALSRTDIEESARRDFYLYIDEFQNFTTDSISVILSEARKYRLNLIIAHQFIAQLTDEIRESVFGNVGSMTAFRVGAADAESLVKHFGPTFNERDLITVENQHAFAKLLLNGEPAKPFNFKTNRAVSGSGEVKDKLKELSRLTYGRDLIEIEREILDRLRG